MKTKALLWFILPVLWGQPDLQACVCIVQSPAEAFERADAVFVAKVTAIKKPASADIFDRIEMSVLKIWKGDQKKVESILTGCTRTDCGYCFEKGKTYLVYAYRTNEGLFATNDCSGTVLFENAEEDLTYIETFGYDVEIDTDTESACCGSPLSPGDAAVFSLLVLFLFKIRKK